ncbi:thiamine-phosphate kinase [Helicobacter sp. 16-1353]|uniref:thiamine-phosphate kinase n=1 Tax=Helicobacter sp. 16-1353 TaxID=2004996 RepID=UPI000DCCF773|nr:thiamine-phosphate kinase [Helicobacter sp. 16-1353]RAX54018.1 thiamine-phosphate kinase [Helicobacter sp. 16-1353]
MDRESFFISKLQDSGVTLKLDDDGILIDKYVYAMDLFCENVHFTKEHFSYYQIATKAMLVNISDILAMGVKPQYAMLGISFNDIMKPKDISQFQQGIVDICKQYNIKIIGGDTIKDDKLNIAITMFGKKNRYIIQRKNFKANDVVFFTGTLGNVLKDMKFLYNGRKLAKKSKFYLPELKEEFIYDILPFIKGGMDISDGLFYELNRISKLNNVRFKFYKKINKYMALSGEEYELLFSVSIKHTRKLQIIANKHRVKITKLAKILNGRQRFYCRPHHK